MKKHTCSLRVSAALVLTLSLLSVWMLRRAGDMPLLALEASGKPSAPSVLPPHLAVTDPPSREAAPPADDLPPPLGNPAFRPQKVEQLPPDEQASLHRAIFSAMHAVEPLTEEEAALPENEGVSHFATNGGQKFNARFLKDGGVRLGSSLPGQAWQGTVRVVAGGGAGAAAAGATGGAAGGADRPHTPYMPYGAYTAHTPWHATGTRAEREAAPGLTEWYENRAEGLEHGFTLAGRPAGAGESGFTLEVALEGLRAEVASGSPPVPGESGEPPVSGGGQGEVAGASGAAGRADADAGDRRATAGDLVFTDAETGVPVLGYTKLKVWDATGRELAAAMRPTAAGLRFAVRDEDAVYPVTIDPLYVNLQGKQTFPPDEKKFSDSAANVEEHFGHAVALDGTTALVGAPWKTVGGKAKQGAVFVFVRNGSSGAWSLQTTLTINGLANDEFGYAVALEGNTAVIGAPGRTVNGQTKAGEVYVFTRSGTSWTLQTVMVRTLPQAVKNDAFGFSVALSGDTALIGAPRTTRSAYVFVRGGNVWLQQARLTVAWDEDDLWDDFGVSVALEGNVALVGAPWRSRNGDWRNWGGAGAAYVFARSGTTWNWQTMLTASNPQQSANFGNSVALSGNTALIGAHSHALATWPVEIRTGAAYVFVRPGASLSVWSQQEILLASDGEPWDRFGASVALEGNTALVCASYKEVNGMGNQGAAYLYTRGGTTWTEQKKVTGSEGGGGANYSDGARQSIALSGDSFIFGVPQHWANDVRESGAAYLYEGLQNNHAGLSVALDGNVAVVGALDHDLAGAPSAGAAWILERSGSQWSTERKLVDSAPAAHDRFGVAVAISGGRVVVGADYDDVDGRTDCGSVSVYERMFTIRGTTWPRRYLFRGHEGGNQLGRSVAIDGVDVAAGAPGVNGGAGEVRACWLYKPYPDSWESLTTDIDSPAPQAGANFGFSVALSGGKLIVGSPGYNPTSGGTTYNNGGRVDFYTMYQASGNLVVGHAGTSTRYVTNAGLGFSVAMEGNVAVAGSTSPPGWFTGSGSSANGLAVVFTHNGTAWGTNPFGTGAMVTLDNAGFAANQYFGSSVAISSDVIAVGAFGNSGQQGFVRLFRKSGTSWVKEAEDIKAFSWMGGGSGDCFGISTAMSGSTLLVGAYGIDSGSGAAFPYLLYDGSTPPVLTIRQRGVNVELTWPLGTGKALYRSETLANGSWIKITGSENLTSYSYPISGERMFFRLGPK